jgi:ankyrin repeat protein
MAVQHLEFNVAVDAIDSGDTGALATLLAAHPDLVHARAAGGRSPYDGYFASATLLHHVAGNPVRCDLPENIVAVTRQLLDAGAAVDAECGGGPAQPDSGGGTTLGLVASSGQAAERGLAEPLIDTLLDAGADLDRGGNGGLVWIALYHTVECRSQREVAGMLHDRGAEVDMVLASGLGRLDLVRGHFADDGSLMPGADRLYRHHRRTGADATPQQVLQDALVAACIGCRFDVVDFLLENGADIDGTAPWGAQTVTGLHGAAWAGWTAVARHLMERGADVHIRDEINGATPIGWAVYCGRQDVVDYFLEDESNLGLIDAVEVGRLEHVQALLGDGDPDQAVEPGDRGVLLRVAAYAGRRDVVRFLLDRGAAPALRDRHGRSALDIATEHGHEELARLLSDRQTG